MGITISLRHVTQYRYERAVRMDPQVIRLRPAPHCRTPVLSYSLEIVPGQHFINWQQDPQANYLARLVFPEKVNEFRVEVNLVAEISVINPFDFFLEPDVETLPFKLGDAVGVELASYRVQPVGCGERFASFLASHRFVEGERTVDFLVDLNRKVQEAVKYLVRMEPGVQTPEQTLELGSGSCRDSSWLLVNLLRGMGLAARFVSGYLIQLKPDVEALDGPSGAKEDFTDLHAWVEVYLPGAGWLGLDPTSGLLAGEGHLPLACTPTPETAAPISGTLEAAESEFFFSMEVTRIRELPRVTKPYSDAAWLRLNQLGQEVDARLKKGDVRLTMGGEPTFVSVDDVDGEEWTTGAVGVRKRRLCDELLRRMQDRFAKGGFLHHGQGKWYPGESLPRWAYSCYWRRDGEPLWRDKSLQGEMERDYGYGVEDARRFLECFSRGLGFEGDYVHPAFEDVGYYLWKEGRLPENVNPIDNRLNQPEERERLAVVFERGLEEPKGYVLPLRRVQMWQGRMRGGWKSEKWKLRRKFLFLIPGDSPVGLRLPLASLPWVPQEEFPYPGPVDPTHGGSGFWGGFGVGRADQRKQVVEGEEGAEGLGGGVSVQGLAGAGDNRVRTALCVEARGGKIFVFMPPVPSSQDYFELIEEVERTAAELRMPVLIEGDRPPFDAELRHFSVTPDPGVIEVNVHPVEDWGELVDVTEGLYEEARLTRLRTEKFLLDGRHIGTGGGNHIVLGGKKPLDSPFLRRPDLLASLVAYWHHHPSLSYLFSSLFLGPTSQSPRLDEARNDTVYELELALGEVRGAREVPPWLVDRIFRHLLTDVTGNTHRAEFCIDKLYNPDSATGRLGLLELRSIEMPPDRRMSLAQQLLIRALVVLFWERPYHPGRLVRWGTALHDRMMLPHFIWQDFKEVLDDLRGQVGLDVDEEWYRAHFEFRFPLYGEIRFRDLGVELRGALEPWHVLGEEGYSGSTVRFVDSSVERVQVRVTGWIPERYALVCQGRQVPLVETGRVGEMVAGVRFRTWNPPSCLHPTIGSDVPLVFDVVDRWTMQAVAGCRYHASHPGGRSYDTFPVNAYEAEGRRISRFEGMGYHGGVWEKIPEVDRSFEFPVTLDLRMRTGSGY